MLSLMENVKKEMSVNGIIHRSDRSFAPRHHMGILEASLIKNMSIHEGTKYEWAF